METHHGNYYYYQPAAVEIKPESESVYRDEKSGWDFSKNEPIETNALNEVVETGAKSLAETVNQ